MTSIKMAATMSKPFVKTAHEVRECCNDVKRESKACRVTSFHTMDTKAKLSWKTYL